MRARPGDRIFLQESFIAGPTRHAEILEVPQADGSPPYLVRWLDTREVVWYVPGADAYLDVRGPYPTWY